MNVHPNSNSPAVGLVFLFQEHNQLSPKSTPAAGPKGRPKNFRPVEPQTTAAAVREYA